MGSSKFKPNPRGIQEYLDGQHGVAAILEQKASQVLAAAVADSHDDTHAYENGLHLETTHSDRMVVEVVSGDFKGHILEAKYGILSRALDATR